MEAVRPQLERPNRNGQSERGLLQSALAFLTQTPDG